MLRKWKWLHKTYYNVILLSSWFASIYFHNLWGHHDMQILLSCSQPSFKYLHILKITVEGSKEWIWVWCKTWIFLWAQDIKFLHIFLIHSTIFHLLIKMGKLSLLKNLILLFFQNYFRKYLPGSSSSSFNFLKIFQDLDYLTQDGLNQLMVNI